jgi:hypothetical protein
MGVQVSKEVVEGAAPGTKFPTGSPPSGPAVFGGCCRMVTAADRAQDRAELTQAGLTEVSITEFDVPCWLHNTDEYVEFYRTCLPPGLLDLIRQKFGSVDDPDTWAAVAAAVEPYRTVNGRIDLPGRALLIRAVKPPSHDRRIRENPCRPRM